MPVGSHAMMRWTWGRNPACLPPPTDYVCLDQQLLLLQSSGYCTARPRTLPFQPHPPLAVDNPLGKLVAPETVNFPAPCVQRNINLMGTTYKRGHHHYTHPRRPPPLTSQASLISSNIISTKSSLSCCLKEGPKRSPLSYDVTTNSMRPRVSPVSSPL